MSQTGGRGRKGLITGKRATLEEKSNHKDRGGQQESSINEVFFVSPVVAIGRHGVPMGTITGPGGKRQCLCVYVGMCVTKDRPL